MYRHELLDGDFWADGQDWNDGDEERVPWSLWIALTRLDSIWLL